jgi:hypothetical protein
MAVCCAGAQATGAAGAGSAEAGNRGRAAGQQHFTQCCHTVLPHGTCTHDTTVATEHMQLRPHKAQMCLCPITRALKLWRLWWLACRHRWRLTLACTYQKTS